MNLSDWYDLLKCPEGHLIRILSVLFKYYPATGAGGPSHPKGQIVLITSIDGYEDQLPSLHNGSKRLDEFFTTSFVTGSGSAHAAFVALLEGRLVKIGLSSDDVEFIEAAEE